MLLWWNNWNLNMTKWIFKRAIHLNYDVHTGSYIFLKNHKNINENLEVSLLLKIIFYNFDVWGFKDKDLFFKWAIEILPKLYFYLEAVSKVI